MLWERTQQIHNNTPTVYSEYFEIQCRARAIRKGTKTPELQNIKRHILDSHSGAAYDSGLPSATPCPAIHSHIRQDLNSENH